MNLDYIKQQDIARRYLQGKLSAVDNTLFEEFILDKPELITQLELDDILLNNLSKSDDKSKIAPPAVPVIMGQTLHDVWKLGLAAAIGALMVMPFVQQRSVEQINSGQLEGNNHIAYLESARSVNTTIKNIVISADAQQLILMIQPATLDESIFSVSFKQDGEEKVNTYNTQSQLANSGDLIITLPTNILKQGRYSLELSGVNSSFKQTFVFELTRAKT